MAGETITYTFVGVGNDTIARMFEDNARAAERSGSRVTLSYQRPKTEAEKTAAAQAKAAKDAAKQQESAAQKAATAQAKADAARVKSTERAEQQRWKEVEKASAKIQRELEKEATAAERAAARKAKAEEQAAKKRNAAIVHGGKVALGLAAAGATAVAGVIGKAAGEALGTQKAANRISITGGRTVDPTTIRRELEATAAAHAGQTGEGLAAGVAAFQEHRGGDRGKALEEARRYEDVIATVASGTGKGAEEIGKAAALLAKRGDIKTVEQMGNALAQVAAHARESGVPLEEAIGHLDKMGALAKRIGLKDSGQLGALQKLGAEGAGAEGGDKAVESFFKKVLSDKTARTLKGAGIDPYADKNGNVLPPRELLKGLFENVGSSVSASDKISTINKLVGPQGAKMVDPLAKAYSSAYGATTGTDQQKVQAGVDAMLAAFDRAATETGTYADMKAAAGQAETDASAKLEQAWQKVVGAAGDELVPTLTQLAGELAKSPDVFHAAAEAAKILAEALKGAAWVFTELFGGGNKQTNDPEKFESKAEFHEAKAKAIRDGAQGRALTPQEQNAITAEEMGAAAARASAKATQAPAAVGAPPAGGGAGTPVAGGSAAQVSHAGTEAAAHKIGAAADKLSAAADKLGRSGGSIYGRPGGQALDGR